MSDKLPRFFQSLNMRVVRLTVSEAAAASARFGAAVTRAEADGLFDGIGAFQVHKSLYAAAHFGCDAVTTVPDGTALEPLPEPAS